MLSEVEAQNPKPPDYESSVVVSLSELLNIEKDRLESEAESRVQRAEARRLAEEEATREELRIRDELARHKRAEEAHLSGIVQGELAAAQIKTQAEEEARLLAQKHRFELELTQHQASSGVRTLKQLLQMASCVFALGLLILFSLLQQEKRLRQDEEQRYLVQLDAKTKLAEQAKHAERELDEQLKASKELVTKLANERDALRKEASLVKGRPTFPILPRVPDRRPPPQVPEPPPTRGCLPGDPMCRSL